MDIVTSALSKLMTMFDQVRTLDLILLCIILWILWQQRSLWMKVRKLQRDVHDLHRLSERSLLTSLQAGRNTQDSRKDPNPTTGESADIVALKPSPTR
jgi:hypothetical protein